MKNINTYFNDLAVVNFESYENELEKVVNLYETDFDLFEEWAKENNVDLEATDEHDNLELTYWAWDYTED